MAFTYYYFFDTCSCPNNVDTPRYLTMETSRGTHKTTPTTTDNKVAVRNKREGRLSLLNFSM